MNYSQLLAYLKAKPNSFEDYPFGPDTVVFKICGKVFALMPSGAEQVRVNLKCEPNLAVQLRDVFEAVRPGYHMNKRHWNTVSLDGSIPRGEIERMIDHSYALVIKGLKKIDREALFLSYGQEQILLGL